MNISSTRDCFRGKLTKTDKRIVTGKKKNTDTLKFKCKFDFSRTARCEMLSTTVPCYICTVKKDNIKSN